MVAAVERRCTSAALQALPLLSAARAGSAAAACEAGASLSRAARAAASVRFSSSSPASQAAASVASEAGTVAAPSDAGVEGAAPRAPKTPSTAALYAELSKARLSSLVVMTSGAGYLLAGPPACWATCGAAVVGTSLAASAAATFNQVWEKDTDKLMKRTQRRPLPAGSISPGGAMAFGSAMTAASGLALAAGTTPLTAALGLGNIALYAAIYTPLKRISEWNTAVGAIVGALPPLMGWAAATGCSPSELLTTWEPVLAAATLFWWQFPHFYALGWNLRHDYRRGGFQMVPCNDPSGKRTAWYSLRSAAALATVPLIAAAAGVASPMFAVEGLLLNGVFLSKAWRFYSDPHDGTARSLFRASLWYLPLLLALFVFHSKRWHTTEAAEEVTAAAVSASETLGVDSETTAADAAAGGEGSASGGDALVLALDRVRAAGRALCVHETVVSEQVLAAAASRTQALLAQVAPCGVPADADATASTNGGEEHLSAPLVAAATKEAVATVRGRCPVTRLEDGAAAAAGEASTAAAAAAGADATAAAATA